MYGVGISWEGTVLDAAHRAEGRAEVRLLLQLRRRAARPGPAQRDGVPARASRRHAADPRGAPGADRARPGRVGAGCCRRPRRRTPRRRAKRLPQRRPEEVALRALRAADRSRAELDARLERRGLRRRRAATRRSTSSSGSATSTTSARRRSGPSGSPNAATATPTSAPTWSTRPADGGRRSRDSSPSASARRASRAGAPAWLARRGFASEG